MVGSLAQLIALVTYGNDYLRNGNIPINFDSLNTTFQFCNRVDFRKFKKAYLSSKPKENIVASNPTEWFKYLKTDGCIHLRLYFEHSKDQGIAKDYHLAGFVGGGGVWLIETIYGGYSNYWQSRWEVTRKNASDRKIWTVNYGVLVERQHTSNLQIDNLFVKYTLRHILTEITDFAFRQNLQGWAEQFDKSKAILDSVSPEENYYHKDLIPLNNYPLIAKQIIFSAGSAWVFGGMGWWNDLIFENKEDNDVYNRLSERLYSNIIEAIIAGTNTY